MDSWIEDFRPKRETAPKKQGRKISLSNFKFDKIFLTLGIVVVICAALVNIYFEATSKAYNILSSEEINAIRKALGELPVGDENIGIYNEILSKQEMAQHKNIITSGLITASIILIAMYVVIKVLRTTKGESAKK